MLFVALFLFQPIIAAERTETPSYTISYNALQTLAFVASNAIFFRKSEPKLSYWPFHFDMQTRISPSFGMSFGLVYRYESYDDDGPLFTKEGVIRAKKVWTNFNELFLLAGPRFSPLKTGLLGFYVSAKGGLGTSFSPAYFSVSMLLQPETGYVFSFGEPGFSLTLGLGLLLNMPFYESHPFAVPWRKKSNYGALGVLVHQAIPILNLGLGFSW